MCVRIYIHSDQYAHRPHRRGVLFKAESEIAGFGLGGDTNFVKNSVELNLKHDLGTSVFDFGLGLRAGLLLPYTWKSSPSNGFSRPPTTTSHIADRFFLGGPTDVRGFALRGLGPHAGLDSLGGDVFWAIGAHIYAPLPFTAIRSRIGDSLRTHFFANAGALGALPLSSDALPLASRLSSAWNTLKTNIGVTVGLGLSLDFQNFSIELNYCWPLQVGPSQAGQQHASPGIQFGVGFSFL